MAESHKIVFLYQKQSDYSPVDSIPGWVSHFRKYFSTLLNQVLMVEPNLQFITAENLKSGGLDDALVVIMLVSEEWKQEHAALAVVKKWIINHKNSGTLEIEGTARFIKVCKFPFQDQFLLPEAEHLIAEEMYYLDAYGEPQEFKQFFNQEAERAFWMKLADLAYDIASIVKVTDKKEVEEVKPPERSKTIFLASTGVDVIFQRDIIRRELKQHGYEILPKRALPTDLNELIKTVKDDLERSCLSIHLIGEDYGFRPQGYEFSIVEIQDQIANDYTEQVSLFNSTKQEKIQFNRMIWVSPEIKNISERQKIFIENIKSEAARWDEAEVLQVPLNDLKSIIKEQLSGNGRMKMTKDAFRINKIENSEQPLVYLIRDQSDSTISQPITNYLLNKGIKIVYPGTEGSIMDLRYVHTENLRQCDGCILYIGNAPSEWIKAKFSDVLKSPGFGRDKQMKAKAVVISNKARIDTSFFERNNTLVLKEDELENSEFLEPFVNKIFGK